MITPHTIQFRTVVKPSVPGGCSGSRSGRANADSGISSTSTAARTPAATSQTRRPENAVFSVIVNSFFFYRLTDGTQGLTNPTRNRVEGWLSHAPLFIPGHMPPMRCHASDSAHSLLLGLQQFRTVIDGHDAQELGVRKCALRPRAGEPLGGLDAGAVWPIDRHYVQRRPRSRPAASDRPGGSHVVGLPRHLPVLDVREQ